MRVFVKVFTLGVFSYFSFLNRRFSKKVAFFNWDSLHARPLRGKGLHEKEEKG